MWRKYFWIFLGWIGLVMGAVGAVVPVLPAFPFLLLAAYAFGKSSKELHTWFMSTKLYKNNLESYLNGKGMTIKAKIRVSLVVTLTMTLGFLVMKNLFYPRLILSIVWISHLIYFAVGVKTIKEKPQFNHPIAERADQLD